jgi:urease accessory protein
MIVPLTLVEAASPGSAFGLEPGSGRLQVDKVAGQSTVTSVWSKSPLQILTPRFRGESVSACLGNLGGGLVAGDDIRLTVVVGPQAKCFLGTQASTKVYRNPELQTCSQQLKATIGEEALLVVAPDPVQAFAGSRYCQRQEFSLENTSGLILVDWFTSGRAACGERWVFSRFQSRNEIVRAGKRLLVDSLLLAPADGPLADPLRLGRFNCLALVLILGPALQSFSARLLDEVGKQCIVRRAPLVTSVSPVAGGVLLRMAGESVETMSVELRRHLSFLPQILQHDPWARRW